MAKRRSLRFRYTLRALLICLTLFMLWGGYHTNRAWKERAAEEVLRRHPGTAFSYGPRRVGKGPMSDFRFWYQKLVQFVWRERFIYGVQLAFTPPNLANVFDSLPHLEGFSLNSAPLTEQEGYSFSFDPTYKPTIHMIPGTLEHILARHQIRAITLSSWVLDEDDCRALARETTLEALIFCACEMPEPGFAELFTLPRLREFRFSYCAIRGDMLKGMPGSRTLEYVECLYAPVGIEFAGFIGRSPNVVDIGPIYDDLGDTLAGQIDDDFVRAIGPHPSLRRLFMRKSHITERSIQLLASMPALKEVFIPPHLLKSPSAEALRATRPTIKIR